MRACWAGICTWIGVFLVGKSMPLPPQATVGAGTLLVVGGLMISAGPWTLRTALPRAAAMLAAWLVGLNIADSATLCALLAATASLCVVRGVVPVSRTTMTVCLVLAVAYGVEALPAAARVLQWGDAGFRSLQVALSSWHLETRPTLSMFTFGIQFAVAAAGTLAFAFGAHRAAALALLATIAGACLVRSLLPSVGLGLEAAALVMPLATLVIASTLASWIGRRSDRLVDPPNPLRVSRTIAVLVAAVALVGTARLGNAAMSRSEPRERRVGLLRVGLQDFDVPRHGEYGAWSGGMFGLLPRFIRASGCAYVDLNRDDLRSGALANLDTLFLINLNQVLDAGELARLDEFVRRGGCLLVFADHTNVAGLERPTNDVCGRYGIRVRFDSAKNAAAWPLSLGAPAVPWLEDAQTTPWYFPYGIGASLELSGRACPLLRGRFAFSDQGSRSNFPGSYLGNYQLQAQEDFGDQVLVAGARAGRGCVYVFGDTTPIQNGVLPWSGGGFLRRLLTTSPAAPWTWWGWVAWAVMGGCAAAVALRTRLGAPAVMVGVAVCNLVGISLARDSVASIRAPQALQPLCLEWVSRPSDVSPKNRPWRAAWPLGQACVRAGYTVVKTERLTADLVSDAMLVLITVPLGTCEEQDLLLDHVRRGGHVLFCGGPQHAMAVSGLFDALGVAILPGALGSMPQTPPKEHVLESPQLPSAYRIRIPSGRRATPLLAVDDVVCAADFPEGEGSVTVIADDSLPYADHLEGERGWHLGNLAWLDRVIRGTLADRKERGE